MADPCAGADHLGQEVEASVEVRGGACVRGVCVAVVPAAGCVWGWFRIARELREPQYNEGMCQELWRCTILSEKLEYQEARN